MMDDDYIHISLMWDGKRWHWENPDTEYTYCGQWLKPRDDYDETKAPIENFCSACNAIYDIESHILDNPPEDQS